MSLSFSDFFRFERFFTPVLIKALYLVYLIGGGLWTLFSIVMLIVNSSQTSSTFMEYGEDLDPSLFSQITGFGIVGAIMGYLAGALLLRLVLEGLIVVFNIYSNLRSMRDSLENGSTQSFSPSIHQ